MFIISDRTSIKERFRAGQNINMLMTLLPATPVCISKLYSCSLMTEILMGLFLLWRRATNILLYSEDSSKFCSECVISVAYHGYFVTIKYHYLLYNDIRLKIPGDSEEYWMLSDSWSKWLFAQRYAVCWDLLQASFIICKICWLGHVWNIIQALRLALMTGFNVSSSYSQNSFCSCVPSFHNIEVF